MSLRDNLGRMASTLAAMLQTRLELVSVELEEELIRFSTYIVCTLIALFCAGVAISLGVILVIAVYWDEHRIAVLLCLIGLFAAMAVLIGAWLNRQFANKPRLLEQSIAELRKDAELLHFKDAENREGQS